MQFTHDPEPSPESEGSFLEILERAQKGSSEAIEVLVERFYPQVETLVHERLARDVRTGRPWLRARFSTGDLVQEVFASVLKDLNKFFGETEQGFCGWLAMVVRNRIVDSIRFHEAGCRDGRVMGQLPEGADAYIPGTATDPAQAATREEDFLRLAENLQVLDDKERYLVRGRIEGGLSFRELAEHLGLGSESTARRAFFAAQSRLVLLMSSSRDNPDAPQ